MIAKERTLTYASLFSSAGVGCYGFHEEGFECVCTNELVERRLNVQRCNGKCRFASGYVSGDISKGETKERIYAEIRKWASLGNDRLDVLIATPPCQGISVINHKKNTRDINRNSLVVESVEIIRNVKPRVFIFENVQAFQKTLCITPDEQTLPIGRFIQKALGGDYMITGRVLNFMNYGSNSSRTRTLMIGVDRKYRNEIVPYDLFPEFRRERTLREVIGGFRSLEWGEIDSNDFYHAFRVYDIEMRGWIHDLKEGESAFDNEDPKKRPHRTIGGVVVENTKKNRDKYTRQRWDRFVQCVHTRNDQLAAQNTVHPEQDRVFSVRELMAMMTIPRDFKWVDKTLSQLNAMSEEEKKAVYRANEVNIRQCLGEAVPTEVMRQIAAKIKRHFLHDRQTPLQINAIIAERSLENAAALKGFIAENPCGLSVTALMRIAELCNAKREENEAFYTNKFMVGDIMGYIPDFGKDSIRILEPSVGVGNFLPFLFKRYESLGHVHLDVVDIDPDSIAMLKQLLKKMGVPKNFTVNVINDDFLTRHFDSKYDLVIGNPPFSKLRGNLDKYSEVLNRNVNQNTKDLAELFLEKSMGLGSFVALVLNKTLLATDEYAATREFLRRNRIFAILDFGRYGFSGVSIETMCLMVEPRKAPANTMVYNMKMNTVIEQEQHYITDRAFPYFIIYRNREFDAAADKMTFGVFDVVRDRQITKKNTTKENGRGRIRVIKARNIADDGSVVNIHDYDTWIDAGVVKDLAISRFIGDESVYLSPNMTYNPRVIRNDGNFVPDGSVAVLIPKQGISLSAKQMAWFASDEYRRFYAVARNFSTQSINIDKTSVFFFGVPNHD